MKFLLSLLVLIGAMSSCDSRESISRADPVFEEKLPITIVSKGISEIPNDGREIEDFEVTVTNNTESPVHLLCATPKLISEYIRVRNPQAICYDTVGRSGASHLDSLGLSGSGVPLTVEAGDKISFTAPIPVADATPKNGEFQIVINAYIDEKKRKCRIFYSDTTIHNREEK